MASNTFGPTALATPANAVTTARLAAAPALLALVIAIGPASWLLVGCWVVLAGTDGIDGWLARRQGTTRSGAFLDPLADKFLTLGALIGLVARREVMWAPVAIIAVREVAMSVFRYYAARRGVSVPARQSAKLKTAAQDLAILLAFIPEVGGRHSSVVTWALWVAVALTVYTGLEYLHDGRRVLAV
jgi:CDP-diacylglycerol--glycerol-3-phosphate 3-phosphatidyltransferase